MSLLEFPPEILQLILQRCTTPSFLQAALSCRTLFNVASDSRAVVLHHLNLTPGLPAGSLDSPTPSTLELLSLLKKRAAAYLYGADIHANCNTFVPNSGSIDPRACALRQSGDPSLAVVQRGKPEVHLYRLVPGATEPVCKLSPPPEYTGVIQVLRVVFARDNNTISVLVRYRPNTETASDPVHPYVKEALKHFREPGIHLIHYRRKAPGKPFSYIMLSGFANHECYMRDYPAAPHYTKKDYFDNNYEPLAIDVANPFCVAVCWRHNRFHDMRKVVIHTARGCDESGLLQQKLSSVIYRSTTIVDPNGLMPNVRNLSPNLNTHGPVVKVRFNDRCSQLLYYHSSATIYRNYQLLYIGDGNVDASNVHRNISDVLYEPSRSEDEPGTDLSFTIDIPIFCTHEQYTLGQNHVSTMCHWQYISLGTATEPQTRKPVAALLRSEAHCRSRNCGHIPNLERGRRLDDWTMVARLLDYEASSSSSLAGTTAASPGGKRLAVATWKTIRIWAFEPSEIIAANANGFYPPGLQHSPAVVDIEPIVLCPDAVTFSLSFVGEDELVCLTDKGVMRWDLGPLGTGQRGAVEWLPVTEDVVDDEPDEYPEEDAMDTTTDDEFYDSGEDENEDEDDDGEDEEDEDDT